MKKNEESTIGGKARRLIEMKEAGFPVKDCFCIDVNIIAEIIASQKVNDEISREIISLIGESGFGYAVRSSAVGEDGVLSWAGQFKTELFVSKIDLSKAILSCANQQNGVEVIAYSSSLDVEIPKLALVVQEMINPRIAGVIFSKNPVNNKDEIVIEVVKGIGSSLVDGTKQPTRYVIDSQSKKVIEKHGVEEEIVEINDKEIQSMIELAHHLSNYFGKPQDIEWAIDNDNQIFITQSRDITTSACQIDIEVVRQRVIGELREEMNKEMLRLGMNGDVLSDQNVAEILTTHPCQMAFGLFTFFFTHGDGAIRNGRNEIGYEIGSELDRNLQILVGGQPRCSISHDAFTYRIKGIPYDDYKKIVKYYLKRISGNHDLANYPEIVLYDQNPSLEFLESLFGNEKARLYKQAFADFFINFRNHEEEYDKYCYKKFIPEWRKSILQFEEKLDRAETIEGMTALFKIIADTVRTQACKTFVKGTRVGFFAFARLRNLLTDLFGEEEAQAINILSAGIPIELNINLLFSIKLAQYRDGKISLDEVIREFGHLGIHELEISTLRYRDQAQMIDELAKQIIGDPGLEYKNAFQRSEQKKQELILKLNSHDAEILSKEIDVTRRYLPLREVLKFEFLRGYDLLRRLAVKIEKKIEWGNGLIFHLKPQEVFVLDSQEEQLKNIAEKRKIRREEEKTLFVPQVIFTDNLEAIGYPPESEDRILRGVGATNQVIEGVAIIVRNPRDKEAISKLKPGMILVTQTTDPAWSPMLSVITSKGGLVTEVGGILGHAAVYAREVGMAAVLNVKNATTKIKTGDFIRVNGLQGYVEILS